jgi:uncharacterized protein YfiM (DUF2279 family)
MNTLTLLLALTLSTQAPPQTPRERDRWLAEDKLRHAFASMAVVGFAHAGARVVGIDGTPAVLIGISTSAAAGIWKELHDRRSGRVFSLKDLVWDAMGITLGAVLVANVRP